MSEVSVGDTFRHPFQTHRPKCHVRGFVDDQVIVRWWRPAKQRWEYEAWDSISLQFARDVTNEV